MPKLYVVWLYFMWLLFMYSEEFHLVKEVK